MIGLIRTTPAHPEFIRLVHDLDQTLRMLDGEDHVIYAPLNKTNTLKHAVLAMDREEALACGAFKHYSRELAEIILPRSGCILNPDMRKFLITVLMRT